MIQKPPPSERAAITSPFGASARWVQGLSTATLRAMYQAKCGADVQPFFGAIQEIDLYECSATGMRFWRPATIAGPEALYQLLSASWPDYYKTDRWEYARARAAIGQGKRVLEVGCGRGYFLRSLEAGGHTGVGLELNSAAIANKVTAFDVRQQLVEDAAAAEPESFDVVCSFQVLEHVVDPAGFIRSCVALVRPGGLLLLSTPNNDFALNREMGDAFDLPPHHINHFTPTTFRNIADHLGLELVAVPAKSVRVWRRPAPVDHSGPPLRRILQRSADLALRLAAGTTRAPGHTILAILRVPAAR